MICAIRQINKHSKCLRSHKAMESMEAIYICAHIIVGNNPYYYKSNYPI